jgi:hypothetical protein
MILVTVAFTFNFLPADAVCLVPMKFRNPNPTTLQTDCRDPFEFSPPPLAISSLQPLKVVNSASNRNDLDVRNLAEDFKVHRARI